MSPPYYENDLEKLAMHFVRILTSFLKWTPYYENDLKNYARHFFENAH
jgi:hypothetical protein